MTTRTGNVGSLRLDDLGLHETVTWVLDRILVGPVARIYTANIQHLVDVEHDEALSEAFATADQCLCDGRVLLWLARATGLPIRERVTGVDLVHTLLSDPRIRGVRVIFIGARPVDVGGLLHELSNQYTMAQWLAPHHGYFDDDAWDQVVAHAARQRPDIVLAALGSPKQEIWARAMARRMPRGVVITVGGALHVLAGRLPRAPLWMQRAGLEWAFRMLLEPGRLGPRYSRYAVQALPIAFRAFRRRSTQERT